MIYAYCAITATWHLGTTDTVRTKKKVTVEFSVGKFVVGTGTEPKRGFFLGRNPGFQESKIGFPFVGPAGQELGMYLLRSDLCRADFAVSNLYKFFTFDDEPPTKEQLDDHWPVLARELAIVSPQFLVLFGDQVSEYIFARCGLEYRGLEASHGLPFTAQLELNSGLSGDVEKYPPTDQAGMDWYLELLANAPAEHQHLDLILFPCIHPAAGLHSPMQMQLIHQDFLDLARRAPSSRIKIGR